MLQQDHPEDFVLATGETHSVRKFVQKAFKVVGVDIEYDCSQSLYLVDGAERPKKKLVWMLQREKFESELIPNTIVLRKLNFCWEMLPRPRIFLDGNPSRILMFVFLVIFILIGSCSRNGSRRSQVCEA